MSILLLLLFLSSELLGSKFKEIIHNFDQQFLETSKFFFSLIPIDLLKDFFIFYFYFYVPHNYLQRLSIFPSNTNTKYLSLFYLFQVPKVSKTLNFYSILNHNMLLLLIE